MSTWKARWTPSFLLVAALLELFVAGSGLVMNVCHIDYKPSVFFQKSTEASHWQVNLSFCSLGLWFVNYGEAYFRNLHVKGYRGRSRFLDTNAWNASIAHDSGFSNTLYLLQRIFSLWERLWRSDTRLFGHQEHFHQELIICILFGNVYQHRLWVLSWHQF